MRIVPVTQRKAEDFVATFHRHNEAPLASVFQIGLANDDSDELIGVAMVGIPKARMSCDGFTLEVNRTCTDGSRNANSMLYGACARAAAALGWKRLITYTLPSESGSSLKGAGWTLVGVIDAKGSWEEKRGGRAKQSDIFGEKRMPLGPKRKWEKLL